jgi:hypothetical protein
MIAYENRNAKHPVMSGIRTGAYFGGIAVGFCLIYGTANSIARHILDTVKKYDEAKKQVKEDADE